MDSCSDSELPTPVAVSQMLFNKARTRFLEPTRLVLGICTSVNYFNATAKEGNFDRKDPSWEETTSRQENVNTLKDCVDGLYAGTRFVMMKYAAKSPFTSIEDASNSFSRKFIPQESICFASAIGTQRINHGINLRSISPLCA